MEPGGGFSDGKVSGLSHPSPSSPILVSPLSTIERGGNAHHLLNTSKWRFLMHHVLEIFGTLAVEHSTSCIRRYKRFFWNTSNEEWFCLCIRCYRDFLNTGWWSFFLHDQLLWRCSEHYQWNSRVVWSVLIESFWTLPMEHYSCMIGSYKEFLKTSNGIFFLHDQMF